MPSGLPFPQAACPLEQNLEATPSTLPGTTLTGGASHTKGTYQSLIDPTTFETQIVLLRIAGPSQGATNTDALVDIAVAPAGGGSEQIIIPDMLAGWLSLGSQTGAAQLVLPMSIPAGVAIRGRCQGLIASETVDVAVQLIAGMGGASVPVYAGCDAYGINSSGDSSGTSHTAGNTGAESAWTNFGSTMSRHYRGLLLRAHPTNTTTNNIAYHFEVGYSSTTLAEFHINTVTTEAIEIWPSYPVPCFIPSGTQLQIRGEASGTAQALDIALYCFY